MKPARSTSELLRELHPAPWLGNPVSLAAALAGRYQGERLSGTHATRNASLLLSLVKAAGASRDECQLIASRRRKLRACLALLAVALPDGSAVGRIAAKAYAELYLRSMTILDDYDISLADAVEVAILAG